MSLKFKYIEEHGHACSSSKSKKKTSLNQLYKYMLRIGSRFEILYSPCDDCCQLSALDRQNASWTSDYTIGSLLSPLPKTHNFTSFQENHNDLLQFFYTLPFRTSMGPLQLSNHVVQNRQIGEHMTHWAILNKDNSNLVALFNMPQCVICSPVWRFCTT